MELKDKHGVRKEKDWVVELPRMSDTGKKVFTFPMMSVPGVLSQVGKRLPTKIVKRHSVSVSVRCDKGADYRGL